MSASVTQTLRISHPLSEAVKASFSAWGYEDSTAAARGCLRYAILARGEHVITAVWASWSLARQHTLDEALAILAGSGRTVRTSWLQHSLDRLAGTGAPPRLEDPALPLRIARDLVTIAREIRPSWTPRPAL